MSFQFIGIMNNFFSYLQIGLVACTLLIGCRQKRLNVTDEIAAIDVVHNLGKYQSIPVSRFVSELAYIPLETGNYCLIGEDISNIIVTNSHIFLAGSNYCYDFDRKGRFIGNISRIGQGPGEYQSIVSLSIDLKKQSLYIETFRNILEYSWDRVFRQSINKPIDNPIDNVSFVRDKLFIGHVPNYSGHELYSFLLFDKSGQVIKSFDNHITIDRPQPRYLKTEHAMQPFKISESIYVKENTNDTLYCLNEHNELIPLFVFDLGKYTFSKEKRNIMPNVSSSLESLKGTIEIPDSFTPMVGIPNYIFFSINARELPKNIPFPQKKVQSYVVPSGFQIIGYLESHNVVGIYDVVNKTTLLLDTDPVSWMFGLINDLDGGLSFWPKYYTSENEMVDIWQAYEMKAYLTEEYFAAHEIKDPEAFQKLKELLKNLDEEDNPVIVIGKLK